MSETDEMLARLNKMIEKKAKISIEKANAAVKLLYEIYKSNGDMKFLCRYLYTASYVVAGKFVESYYISFDENKRQEFIKQLISVFSGEKATQVILSVGFSIISEIVKKEPQDIYFLKLLNYLLQLADGNDGFTETKCKTFKDHLLDKTNGVVFLVDFSAWSRNEKHRFFRFTNKTIYDISKVSYTDKIKNWMETNEFSKPNSADETTLIAQSVVGAEVRAALPINTIAKFKTETEVSVQKSLELIRNLELANQEVQKLYTNAFEKSNAFKELEDRANNNKSEIALMKAKIEEQYNTIVSNNLQTAKLEQEIANKNEEISDLLTRIKASFAIDDINKSQEITTLKKDIASAIRLQYTDYYENKDVAFTEDNYEALKASLNQIFKTLKRYGIEF